MKLKLHQLHGQFLMAGLPISINFGVTGRVRGPLSEAGLQDALDRLARRHPLLAAHVVADGAGRFFFSDAGARPPTVEIYDRGSDTAWVDLLTRVVRDPTNYVAGPTFRLLWLRGAVDSELILLCDHVNSDGLAGIYALRDLLTLLAEPDLTLPPLAPAHMYEFFADGDIARIRQAAEDRAVALSDESPFGEVAQDPLQIIPLELSAADSARLVDRCRQAGVSVQSALAAAFMGYFAEKNPDQPRRRMEVPVDLRRRLARPVGERYGLFINLTIVDAHYDNTEPDALWRAAGEYQTALTAAVAAPDFLVSPSIIFHTTGTPVADDTFAATYDISLSNLGRVDIPAQYGPYQLSAIYAPTLNVFQPNHRILGITTFAGRLRGTFITCDPAAEQIMARGRQLLASMLAGG